MSRAEHPAPRRALENEENALPRRTKLLTDTEDEAEVPEPTERLDPKRMNARNDNEEPTVNISRIERLAPVRV
jgi:hypothetical protein